MIRATATAIPTALAASKLTAALAAPSPREFRVKERIQNGRACPGRFVLLLADARRVNAMRDARREIHFWKMRDPVASRAGHLLS
jgi:hypothetical protein